MLRYDIPSPPDPLTMTMSYLRHFFMDFHHLGFIWNVFLVASMPVVFVFRYSLPFIVVSRFPHYPITMKMQYLRHFPMVSHHPGLISNAFYNVLNAIISVFSFTFAVVVAFVVATNCFSIRISGISLSFVIILGSFRTRFRASFHLR